MVKKIKGKQKSNQIADEPPIQESAIERQLGSLFARKDEIVRNLILERQGAATNAGTQEFGRIALCGRRRKDRSGTRPVPRKLSKESSRPGVWAKRVLDGDHLTSQEQTRIGKVLLPVLDPFHKVAGCVLMSVWESAVDEEIGIIALKFDRGILSLSVNEDDDTIEVHFDEDPEVFGECVNAYYPWQNQIGKEFGWGWLGFNQQGYLDTVSISFNSVAPQFCITAAASALNITQCHKVIQRLRGRHKEEIEPRGIELAA